MASKLKFYSKRLFVFMFVYFSLASIALISTIISYLLTGFIVNLNILVMIVSIAYINICLKVIEL